MTLQPASPIGVKICGITRAQDLEAAVTAGASHIGFVFYEGSPRSIDLETAKTLSNKTPSTLTNVGLFVDPKLQQIEDVLAHADLDMLQLHGNETPQQIQKIRGQFGLPVMKAVRVATKEDLEQVYSYEKICDWLLFDTKSDNAQGGTGKRFDWSLLEGLTLLKPWMLAGGLNTANIGQALTLLKPHAVDVSSGVEDAPGVKNADKIKEFVAAVQQTR